MNACYVDPLYTLYHGDALEVLKELPNQSVHCCVTSPPYWGLRDYGTGRWDGGDEGCDHMAGPLASPKSTLQGYTGPDVKLAVGRMPYRDTCGKCGAVRIDAQLGLEKTPDEYVAKMVEVFREVRRVLRDDGTLWLNLGDCYAASPAGNKTPTGISQTRPSRLAANLNEYNTHAKEYGDLPAKNLLGMPWRVAFALQQPYYTGRIKDDRDRVWLAAMIEAEGCLFIHKRKAGQNNGQGYERQNDNYAPGLEVANCHRAIVERCMAITGIGSICSQSPDQNNRRKQTIHRWNLRTIECRDIIRECYPYFVGKQHQARLLCACPSSGVDAERAHAGLIALHNGNPTGIDFKPPTPMFEPGFYLRSDIIWSKCNPMPESVTDRPTKAHEYIFLLSKSERYYYDIDATREPSEAEAYTEKRSGIRSSDLETFGLTRGTCNPSCSHPNGRNKRSVWTVATSPYPEAHFATYPPDLIKPCILAGCPLDGTVLDPFAGSGTTGQVALELGRKAVLIELNAAYLPLIQQRLHTTPGLRLG